MPLNRIDLLKDLGILFKKKNFFLINILNYFYSYYIYDVNLLVLNFYIKNQIFRDCLHTQNIPL